MKRARPPVQTGAYQLDRPEDSTQQGGQMPRQPAKTERQYQ
jgi:hypothetical protein